MTFGVSLVASSTSAIRQPRARWMLAATIRSGVPLQFQSFRLACALLLLLPALAACDGEGTTGEPDARPDVVEPEDGLEPDTGEPDGADGGTASPEVADGGDNSDVDSGPPCDGIGEDCSGECGDGIAETGELCDADDLRGASCASEGYASGVLACGTDCAFDFGGCSDPIDSCAGVLCLNGGSCFDDEGAASCLCADGFTGVTCELLVEPPDCANLTCENGSVCGLPFDPGAAQTCDCSPYFTGETCATDGPETPIVDGRPLEFWYRWQAEDVTPEIETLPEGVPPPVVDLGGEVVTLPPGSVAQELLDTYSVVLDDALLTWDGPTATALLRTLERFQTPPLPESGDVFRVRRTDDDLTNDIEIVLDDNYVLLTISDRAFTLANPIVQPPHDGVERVFYSNRLYRAALRGFLTTVEALELQLLERHGVTVRDGEPKIDFQRFSEDELITILSTFEDMPSGFRQLPNLRYLTRRKNGLVNPYHPTAPAIAWVGSQEIEFMESAFVTLSLDYLHRLIAHELSHFIYALLDVVDSQTWSDLSGWSEIGEDDWTHTTLTNFVSNYAAAKNPNEDFAESVSYYIYDPDWVRNIAPAKYAFIRDVLDGYEYVLILDDEVVFNVFNLYPDNTFPGRIVRVTNLVTLAEDGSHHATLELRLHQPPYESDTIAFTRMFSPSGDQYRDVYFYPDANDATRLTAELEFGPLDEDGYWRPNNITVRERGGNTNQQGQTSYGWLLWFENQSVDLDPPTTNLNEVTGSVVKIGAEYFVTVEAPADDLQPDDIDGYGELLHYDSGQKITEWGDYDRDRQVVTWTFVVRPYHATDTWTFRTFRLRDASGNVEIYDLEDGPGALDFECETATPDLEPPELDPTSISASASPTNPAAPNGETDVQLTYRMRDNISGLGVSNFRLIAPSGAQLFDYHYHEEFYDPYYTGDPTEWSDWVINIRLPVGSEPGAWGWLELGLCDKAGNCEVSSFAELGIVAPVD